MLTEYAHAGFATIPIHTSDGVRCSCGLPIGKGKGFCSSPGKHPTVPKGVHDAQVGAFIAPGSNVGIAIPAGVVVVDIDPRYGAHESHHELPPTLTQQSGGHPDGRHFFYKVPDGMRFSSNMGKEHPGVDFKQSGGYVVAEPSLHGHTGQPYKWLSWCGIAPAPAWLLAEGHYPDPNENQPDASQAPLLSETEREDLAAHIEPHWFDGQKHPLAKALGGWLRQRGASEVDVADVIARLPNDHDGPIAAALACFRSDNSNGWEALCNIIGESDAAELDGATKNSRYQKPEPEWQDVWDTVYEIQPSLHPDYWPEIWQYANAKPDLTKDYCGLRTPMTEEEGMRPFTRLVEGLDIIPAVVTGIVARPSFGKSPVGLSLGLAIASGTPWLNRKTEQRRVLYLTFEKPRTTNRKKVRIARAMGLRSSCLELIDMTGDALTTPGSIEKIKALCMQQPETVVVIDTYGSACAGLDMNAVEAAEPLKRLAHEVAAEPAVNEQGQAIGGAGAAVIIVMHCKKGDDRPDLGAVAGTGALAGYLEAAIGLHRETDDPNTIVSYSVRALEENFRSFDVAFEDVHDPNNPTDANWGLKLSTPDESDGFSHAAPHRKLTARQIEAADAVKKIASHLMGGNLEKMHDGSIHKGVLKTAIGVTEESFRSAVKEMMTDGRIREVKAPFGLAYLLTDAGQQAYR